MIGDRKQNITFELEKSADELYRAELVLANGTIKFQAGDRVIIDKGVYGKTQGYIGISHEFDDILLDFYHNLDDNEPFFIVSLSDLKEEIEEGLTEITFNIHRSFVKTPVIMPLLLLGQE